MKKDRAKNNKGRLRVGRVVVNLNREEFEFIDNIGRDILFTKGRRITNNKIICAFINVIREIGLDVKGVQNLNELKERILMKLGIGKDRRKYPRFRKEVKVSWRKLESEAKHETGGTKDIGEGGFRIELNEDREAGEVLEFMLQDPDMPDNPIKAFGRIVWVRRECNRGVTEAGIQLSWLPQNEKKRFKGLFPKPANEKVN